MLTYLVMYLVDGNYHVYGRYDNTGLRRAQRDLQNILLHEPSAILVQVVSTSEG
jgi:hypothetical protein